MGDMNDGRNTFGVLTNEPPFDQQLQNVKHFHSADVPGNWFSGDRFIRTHLVKSGIEQPKSYQEAVANAVAVINSVTVPMGEIPGTGGQGSMHSHTHWGIIRDHHNPSIYFRSETNPSYSKVVLSNVPLRRGNREEGFTIGVE